MKINKVEIINKMINISLFNNKINKTINKIYFKIIKIIVSNKIEETKV